MCTRWIAISTTLALACTGKSEPPPPPPSPPPAKPAPPLADAAVDPRCASPCLFLDTTPLADAPAAFAKACAGSWPATSDSDCGQLDFERNCIYAAHGYTFKRKAWTDTFSKLAWYKPRADFAEKDLPATATANIAELKRRGTACRSSTVVPADDNKVAGAWLAKLAAGTPEVPPLSFDHSVAPPERLKPADMRKLLLGAKPNLVPGKVRMSPAAPRDTTIAAFAGRKLHGVSIDDSAGCTGDEECGGTTVTLVLDDKGKLVALEWQMSACPLVYSLGDAPTLEGEILRGVDRASLEQTRTLPIHARQCAGLAHYRVAEVKREVTYLDEIELVVDGVVLSPLACAAGTAPYCANDGVALRLAQGDHVDLDFAIPQGARCDSVALRVNGHYEPVTP